MNNYIIAGAQRQAEMDAQKAAFFMRGGKVKIGASMPEHPLPPPRSTRIDPETVLQRKRRQPSPSERAAPRRMADAP